MTNEQREAIELAKEFTKMDFSNKMGWTGYYDAELKELSQAIDTVLSLIKEQQEEIGSLQKELNEENKRSMILANNDKFKEQVIDLMALAIINYDDQLVINQYKNINEVKQYYAGLVEKE